MRAFKHFNKRNQDQNRTRNANPRSAVNADKVSVLERRVPNIYSRNSKGKGVSFGGVEYAHYSYV